MGGDRTETAYPHGSNTCMGAWGAGELMHGYALDPRMTALRSELNPLDSASVVTTNYVVSP